MDWILVHYDLLDENRSDDGKKMCSQNWTCQLSNSVVCLSNKAHRKTMNSYKQIGALLVFSILPARLGSLV